MANNDLENFINKNVDRAEEYQEIIESMLSDYDSYGYAESTLVGILNYVEANGNITPRQIEAVNNIKDNPSRYNG